MLRTQTEYLKQLEAHKQVRSSFIPIWRDLSDLISPRSSRFLVTDHNRGDKHNAHVLDGTAMRALRTLVAGFTSGVTNPNRPWLALTVEGVDIKRNHRVRTYLHECREVLLQILVKSNFYDQIPSVYWDLGLYGTSACAMLEDWQSVMRFQHWPVGSYVLTTDARGRVNGAIREFQMQAGQLVAEYGVENVSDQVKAWVESGNTTQWVDVVHVVGRNPDADLTKLHPKHMEFVSDTFEKGQTAMGKWLRQSGTREFPIIAPRWQVYGEDVYGVSPAMEAFGFTRGLQKVSQRKYQVLDKFTQPSMQAPAALARKRIGLLPGEMTYLPTVGAEVKPTHQITNPHLAEIREDIYDLRQQIRESFYADLFLMIANDQRSNVTAAEIAARLEEKLLALGPVYLRMNDEVLDVLVDRSWAIAARRGLLPDAPPEIAGADITVEYISTMSQTMKAVGVANIERAMSFAGSMAQQFPDVLDSINSDETLRTYFDGVGTPPNLLRDQDEVMAARDARAQEAQMGQNAAIANSAADTAQKLGNTPISDNNALAQLFGRIQSPLPAEGVLQ